MSHLSFRRHIHIQLIFPADMIHYMKGVEFTRFLFIPRFGVLTILGNAILFYYCSATATRLTSIFGFEGRFFYVFFITSDDGCDAKNVCPIISRFISIHFVVFPFKRGYFIYHLYVSVNHINSKYFCFL